MSDLYRSGQSTVALWGFAVPDEANSDSGCTLRVEPDDGSWETREITVDPDGPNDITVVIPDPVTVSGVMSLPGGPIDERQLLRAATPDYDVVMAGSAAPDGSYQVRLAPGRYRFDVFISSPHADYVYDSGWVDVTGDTVLDFSPPAVPVTVNLVGADGSPATATLELTCSRTVPPDGVISFSTWLRSTATGPGQVTLSGVPTGSDWHCVLSDRGGSFAVDARRGGRDRQRADLPPGHRRPDPGRPRGERGRRRRTGRDRGARPERRRRQRRRHARPPAGARDARCRRTGPSRAGPRPT